MILLRKIMVVGEFTKTVADIDHHSESMADFILKF